MNINQPPPVQRGVAVSPLLLKWIDTEKSCLTNQEANLLTELIEQRCKYGLEKYGQPLMSLDGRDCVVDCMQEAADLLQYAFKAKLNGRSIDLRAQLWPVLKALQTLLEIN
jgi:hypothetical protein